MRYLFLVLFLIPLHCFSQSWKPQYDQFFAELQKGEHQTAVKTGTNLLSIMEKDSSYADVCFYLANTYSVLQDFEKAILYAEEEKALREKIQGNKHGYYYNAINYLGAYYGAVGDFARAIPLYMEVYAAQSAQFPLPYYNTLQYANYIANLYQMAGAVNKAQEMYEANFEAVRSAHTPNDTLYINTMYNLTNFYLQNALYDLAIPMYKMDCDIKEKKSGKKSDEYLTAFYELGELYIFAGRYTEAEKHFSDYAKMAEEKYGKKHIEYATALNNLAVTYEKQNRFAEAEKLYLKSLEIKEKLYTKKSSTYALSLINLGVTYDYMGKYTEAEKVFQEGLTIFENNGDSESETYSNALSNISNLLTEQGKYDKAIEYLKRSMELNKISDHEVKPGYLPALSNLAGVYRAKGDLDLSLKLYEEAEQLFSSTFGKDHTEYGVVLFNLANIFWAKGEYEKAIGFLDQDLAIQEASVGKINEKYINPLQTKANILSEIGKTRMADELYTEAENLYSNLYGKMHPSYAMFLSNYGLFLVNKGDVFNAEKKLQEAWNIQVNAFGEDHPNNISPLCILSNIEQEKKDYKNAEAHLQKAFSIAKQHYKPEQPEYSNVINNLATLYFHLANYEKAEEYYIEGLALRKKTFGEQHTEYANSLNNIGTLYLTQAYTEKDSEKVHKIALKALDYFKLALKTDSIALGYENPNRAMHLHNLSQAYQVLNNTVMAESIMLQSISLEEQKSGEENLNTAISYTNLAKLYVAIGEFEKAELSAKKSLTIYEKHFGRNDPSTATVNTVLAYIYEMTDKPDKAKDHYLTALSSQREELEENFTFLSESEKESYTASVSYYNAMFNSFVLKGRIKDPSLTRTIYDNELYNKGLLFRSSSRMKEIVLNSKSEELISLYTKWMDTKEAISVASSTPENLRTTNIEELEEKANNLEKELVAKSDALGTDLNGKNTKWDDVKSKLKTGQAAIEFLHFTKNDDTQSDLYCALVLTSSSLNPELVELFNADQLKQVIGKNSGTTYESVSTMYGKQKALNVELFSLIWGPLESSLKGINEIFYSPSGMLHKISFSALGDLNGRYVSDKYILHQVSSTAALVDPSKGTTDPSKSNLALIGGVNYDTKATTTKIWSYLPGTLKETEHIQSVLNPTGIKINLLTADLATEDNLKKMDGHSSPEIIHIATHGFFFGDPEEQKEKAETTVASVKFRGTSAGASSIVENPNPLMRSGIVLAGANDIWNEKTSDLRNASAGEDGILTAYEVSLLHLNNTKLIVLSACETGLGDIKGDDGVYGLQRAFRLAGVDFLIMSLWQVPDKETDEFMTAFYNELIKTKEIRKAFTAAQKTMRAKYDPFFWGAFVLIE